MQKRIQHTSAGRLRAILGEPLTWLIILFALSRYAFRLAGVSFDTRPLATSWQIIDPVLLRHDLVRSLFYMHGQPPLYNLFLGVVLKLAPSPATAAWIFGLAYEAMGLLLVILIYRLLRRLGTGSALSFAVTFLFMLSPATVLYENIPYYEYPTALLLCVCALYFHKTVTSFTPGRAVALFTAMAAVIYVRALFQIEWFVVLGLFCLWVLPGHRKQVLTAAAVPLLLVVLLYAKNGVIIGQFATSSWLGMSFSKLTTMQLSLPQRKAMVHAHELSALALIPPYGVPEVYHAYLPPGQPTGIPILDEKRKSTQHINFNYIAYPYVSRKYLDDALTVLRTHPLIYLNSLKTAYLMFFRPSSDYPYIQGNRAKIAPMVRFFDRYVAGQPAYTPDPGFDFLGPQSIGYLIVAGFIVCVVWGGVLAVRFVARRERGGAELALLFLWLNILYVTVVGNAFEMGENQRFRFLVNAFLSIMLSVLAQRALRHGYRRLVRTNGEGRINYR